MGIVRHLMRAIVVVPMCVRHVTLVGRWTLGVGRWALASVDRYEFHSALRTIAWMIHDDFRMHRARVFRSFLLLACRAVGRLGDRRRVIVLTIRMLRDRGSDREQRKCARD